MLFYQYLHNNNFRVVLEAIAKPDQAPQAPMDPLKAGLAHEEYVTGLIHAIYAAAQEAKDFRTMQDVYKRQNMYKILTKSLLHVPIDFGFFRCYTSYRFSDWCVFPVKRTKNEAFIRFVSASIYKFGLLDRHENTVVKRII